MDNLNELENVLDNLTLPKGVSFTLFNNKRIVTIPAKDPKDKSTEKHEITLTYKGTKKIITLVGEFPLDLGMDNAPIDPPISQTLLNIVNVNAAELVRDFKA